MKVLFTPKGLTCRNPTGFEKAYWKKEPLLKDSNEKEMVSATLRSRFKSIQCKALIHLKLSLKLKIF